jgi:hypothetical protein
MLSYATLDALVGDIVDDVMREFEVPDAWRERLVLFGHACADAHMRLIEMRQSKRYKARVRARP